ncbi:hypothetical protein [Elongatibacter sediminis]|uniref:DUF3352 domain-containing protein n=1 Tax=Elongatibacter sediminis TaxID=3119006 RepID=A0AAW9RNY2_9GAMM
MLHTRTLAAAAASMLILAACGRDDTFIDSGVDNDLLAHVPAGTPYLSANLQPIPDEIIDSYLQRAQPVLDVLQRELTSTRQALASAPTSDHSLDPVILALVNEFDGKLNRSGLEELGLDLQAPRALYGMGAFPVFRMGLSDATRLRATIQRILDAGGIAAPQLDHQGTGYWRLPASDDTGAGRGGAIYIAILDNQLTIGIFPASLESELLPHLLGQSMPAESDAAERLQAINERQGYTPYGTGSFDLLALTDELFSSESVSGRALMDAGIDVSTQLGPMCREEIRQIVSQAPRVHSGLTELTSDSVGYELVVEAEPGLAAELAGLVARVPQADPDSVGVLEFALGLKVGALRDFLRGRTAAVAEAPYRCQHLQELNDAARKMYTQLNQPIPPLVNNFEGLRISLNRLGSNPAQAEQVEGVMAIHVEQPEMFVGMAQMFLPDLAALQLTPGAPPARLPASMIPLPGVVAFAALSDSAIGLSVGAGEEARLADYLDEDSEPGGTFLSMNYDTETYLEYTDRFSDQMAQFQAGPDEEPGPIHGLAEAARQAYKAMAGRTDTRMSFSEEGIHITSRMTFK